MPFSRPFTQVNRHRRMVRHYCLKLGLVWQGLTHDLSKYSPMEFWRGVKYYQGLAQSQRPGAAGERDEFGVAAPQGTQPASL